jgi:hypothetical protein
VAGLTAMSALSIESAARYTASMPTAKALAPGSYRGGGKRAD